MSRLRERKTVYVSNFEHHLSTVRSGNPWTSKGRGAVRWGKDDYVLWENGEAVPVQKGWLTPGGINEHDAREFVATGKLPVWGK